MAPRVVLILLLVLLVASGATPFSATTSRTGILIHGCHLGADGWEEIVWGSVPEQKLGRLPHGVWLALQEDAAVVICGTGGSSINGVMEGDLTLAYLKENFADLALDFGERFKGVDLGAAARKIDAITVSDVESRNTVEELERAASTFKASNCDRVILVSSPTHLPRCLRDAERAFKRCGFRPRSLFASPSDTSYAGHDAASVAIIEPAHRGDRDRALDGPLAMNELAARCLYVAQPHKRAFAEDLTALLNNYGRYGPRARLVARRPKSQAAVPTGGSRGRVAVQQERQPPARRAFVGAFVGALFALFFFAFSDEFGDLITAALLSASKYASQKFEMLLDAT